MQRGHHSLPPPVGMLVFAGHLNHTLEKIAALFDNRFIAYYIAPTSVFFTGDFLSWSNRNDSIVLEKVAAGGGHRVGGGLCDRLRPFVDRPGKTEAGIEEEGQAAGLLCGSC